MANVMKIVVYHKETMAEYIYNKKKVYTYKIKENIIT